MKRIEIKGESKPENIKIKVVPLNPVEYWETLFILKCGKEEITAKNN